MNRDESSTCLNVIWNALHRIPLAADPDKDYRNLEITDAQWDDICTAMAWITEDLGVDNETLND